MKRIFECFAGDENANAIFDWIVLMSGVLLVSGSVVASVSASVDTLASDSSDRVDIAAEFSPS